jgi:hypothetical protein
MSQSEGRGGLEWSVFPFMEDTRRSAIVVSIIAAAGVLVHLAFKDGFLTVLSLAILIVSLHTFFTRTTYRLGEDGVMVRTVGVKTFKPWSAFKRYSADGKGVTLSPFARPSRLDPFRSVRLLFGGNRDEVVAFISERVGWDSERSS